MTQTIAITGNTYPVKDQLKALGGRWSPDSKAWMVPADKADAARALVSGSPKQTASHTHSQRAGAARAFGRCADCGAQSKGYYRCYTCSLDYRDGGSRHKGGVSYYDRRGNFVLGDED